ncbi:hypothetical protein Hanom_Chr06g00485321 [Helianthus anomalus]
MKTNLRKNHIILTVCIHCRYLLLSANPLTNASTICFCDSSNILFRLISASIRDFSIS